MSDHTAYQLYVYECPDPVEQLAIVKVINDHELLDDWMGGDVPQTLELGHNYVDNEKSVGQTADIASDLIEAAPGATFVIWEDPNHEWLGSVCMYAPDLGRYDAECDADGNPVFEISSLLEKADQQATVGDFREQLEKLGGKPWQDRMTGLRNKLDAEAGVGGRPVQEAEA